MRSIGLLRFARNDEWGWGGVSNDWPLWEVFVRSRGGLSHRHVGSVHAPDREIALRHARDTYTRRMEGVSLWVVRSSDIVASDPSDDAAMFDPAADKVYRHPTFYTIPDDVKHI
jgi:ring-1,2-phenylacetyl-CoA epoxidase subunit PaaB